MPIRSGGQSSLAAAENCAESATTANPQTRPRAKTSHGFAPKRRPETRQHKPLMAIPTDVTAVLPKRSASFPARRQPAPPAAMTAKAAGAAQRSAKAKRFIYRNNDMADLEDQLIHAREARFKLIVTDGVFSMDGIIAQVGRICELVETHRALVIVDDSHATGFIGPNGRGAHEHCGVIDRVDIVVMTFGKALGGASGGFDISPSRYI